MIHVDNSFAREMNKHKRTFERGDYHGFVKALLLCYCDRPLPEWVADEAIRAAEYTFAHGSTGRGKHGNWRKKRAALKVDQKRFDLVDFHMRARRRSGKSHVSEVARLYGYGKPTPGGSYNIVTREDIFAFVSECLRGKPERGSPEAIKSSYRAILRSKPKRTRGGK